MKHKLDYLADLNEMHLSSLPKVPKIFEFSFRNLLFLRCKTMVIIFFSLYCGLVVGTRNYFYNLNYFWKKYKPQLEQQLKLVEIPNS